MAENWTTKTSSCYHWGQSKPSIKLQKPKKWHLAGETMPILLRFQPSNARPVSFSVSLSTLIFWEPVASGPHHCPSHGLWVICIYLSLCQVHSFPKKHPEPTLKSSASAKRACLFPSMQSWYFLPFGLCFSLTALQVWGHSTCLAPRLARSSSREGLL